MSPAAAASSSSSDLIDSRVSPAQLAKAVGALVAHAQKAADQASKTELLERDDHVWLTVGTKKISSVKKLKPAKIVLPNPLIDPRTTSICLFTKDPQREYKDLLDAKGVKFVARVIGVDKLKGKFKAFEARRQLLGEHGMFLVDERVVPLLPKLLGTKFFKAKKQPIPVNLTRKDLKAELERAVSSTYFHHSPGNSHSIRISSLPPANGATAAKVLANLTAAIPQVAKLIPGGWDNVTGLNIKTASSVALPIWSADGADRWVGLEEDEEMTDADDSAGEDDLVEPAPAVKAKAPAPKKKAAVVAPAPPHPAPAAAAAVPPKAASTTAVSAPKKKAAAAPADKKKVSGATAGRKSIKDSVVGKKGGAKKK